MMGSRGHWFGWAVALGAMMASPRAADAVSPTATQRKSTSVAGQTEDEKTLYSLGVLISHNLENFQLSAAEFELVKAGLIDGFNHRAADVDLAAAGPKTQKLQRERFALLVKKLQEDGQTYLNKAAASPGAQKTASGLVMIPIQAGTGASPGHDDRVNVDYEGKLIDGTVFDSSIKRGQPGTFSLSGVIPCWSEALQLMKVGEESRVICPSALAYGERGAPPSIRPGSTLDFKVKLLGIEAAPPAAAPAKPADSAPAAPAKPADTSPAPSAAQ